MQKNSASQSGFFNLRALGAIALCSVGVILGTFSFACHEPTSRPDALKLECTALEIRDEAQLARQIAQTSLSQFGSVQEALASAPAVKLP